MATAAPPKVAFFCMEYGLHESFPIYTGGLGILAGDILKTAKDLQLPIIGIGILWHEGYSDQYLDKDGFPQHCRQEYDRSHLMDTGLTVEITIKGEPLTCRIWKTEAYHNAPLYLLDANLPDGLHAWVTRRLYAPSPEERIAAAMVLGMGGVRLLRKIGFQADVYHLNEGNTAFAGLELIREKMALGSDFETAWEETRQQVVFTTHTPVMAGNEVYDHDLLRQMGAFAGFEHDQMERIGGRPFNLTLAGLRLSHMANGVSQLHGATARAMWRGSKGAAPIISITNGVHVKTWQNPQIRQTFEVNGNLWKTHFQLKKLLLREIENRTGVTLDLDTLTLGFGHRAEAHKRGGLIFHRPNVIEPLLREGVIQLIFSGKSHPEDDWGKKIVANMAEMAYRFPQSVVFLENYDMELARLLTSGCDVWLGTSQRPLEASGISGIKAALNGVLHLSVLDGWWPEGCLHGVNGWQFGGGYDGPEQTMVDAFSLYEVLLNEVIPTYYEDQRRWQGMMRASIANALHRFSSARMLGEYYNLLYLPPATLQRIRREILQVTEVH